jgi:hypothetical protein
MNTVLSVLVGLNKFSPVFSGQAEWMLFNLSVRLNECSHFCPGQAEWIASSQSWPCWMNALLRPACPDQTEWMLSCLSWTGWMNAFLPVLVRLNECFPIGPDQAEECCPLCPGQAEWMLSYRSWSGWRMLSSLSWSGWMNARRGCRRGSQVPREEHFMISLGELSPISSPYSASIFYVVPPLFNVCKRKKLNNNTYTLLHRLKTKSCTFIPKSLF